MCVYIYIYIILYIIYYILYIIYYILYIIYYILYIIYYILYIIYYIHTYIWISDFRVQGLSSLLFEHIPPIASSERLGF